MVTTWTSRRLWKVVDFLLPAKNGIFSLREKNIWTLQTNSQLKLLLLLNDLLLEVFFSKKYIFFSLRGRISSRVGVVLRLRTNTVRTEHRTLYSSPNVRTIPITTLRFSKDYHHCGNGNMYTLYYTYICSRLYTLVHGYVLTIMYVCERTLLLNRHLIEQPYCGRIVAVFCLWRSTLRTAITRELVDGEVDWTRTLV
jgi:hypothetical protein